MMVLAMNKFIEKDLSLSQRAAKVRKNRQRERQLKRQAMQEEEDELEDGEAQAKRKATPTRKNPKRRKVVGLLMSE